MEDYDDEIVAWHKSDSELSLAEYLKMSDADYRKFIENELKILNVTCVPIPVANPNDVIEYVHLLNKVSKAIKEYEGERYA